MTRNQGKSLLLGLKMKKILMQVKAITILIRRIKMQIIQSNRMKLQLMNVKGVGSPSSGPVVEDYFQLLGCKDVLYYDFCIKLILGLGHLTCNPLAAVVLLICLAAGENTKKESGVVTICIPRNRK